MTTRWLDEDDRMELRAERVAICIADADLTEEEAHKICDRSPELYGTRKEWDARQDGAGT